MHRARLLRHVRGRQIGPRGCCRCPSIGQVVHEMQWKIPVIAGARRFALTWQGAAPNQRSCRACQGGAWSPPAVQSSSTRNSSVWATKIVSEITGLSGAGGLPSVQTRSDASACGTDQGDLASQMRSSGGFAAIVVMTCGKAEMTMTCFIGLDASVEGTAVCMIEAGCVVKEYSARSHPGDLASALDPFSDEICGIGLEDGPMPGFLVPRWCRSGVRASPACA